MPLKALRIIPLFVVLIVSTYLGMLFVEANRQEVVISFGNFQSPGAPLGFVVLTSILVGMCIAGLVCSVELFAIYVQFKRLQRKAKSNDDETSFKPQPLDTLDA